jgi:hypothetical protein
MYLSLSELKNYEKWVGKNAQEVYVAVLAAGGWNKVFPDSVPCWASRIRNYFNANPMRLERLPEEASKRALKQVQRFAFELDCHAVQTFNRTHQNYRPNPWGKLDPPPFKVPAGCPVKASHDVVHTGVIDEVGTRGALSGQVYKDESNRLWYQMAAGSTIYHFGGHPRWAGFEAAWQDKVRGQDDTPVFKLISPDNTGGSHEVILWNDGVDANGWNTGSENLGKAGERWDVRKIIVTEPRYQGSYNYAETVRLGLAAHEKSDVTTHRDRAGFYVNPADRFSPLAMRRFPPNDPQGKRLSTQIKYN